MENHFDNSKPNIHVDSGRERPWGRHAAWAPRPRPRPYERYYERRDEDIEYHHRDQFPTLSPEYYEPVIVGNTQNNLNIPLVPEDERKVAFATFLKTLTTFMVQAKNNDEDLKLVRQLLCDVYGESTANREEDSSYQRLIAIENSVSEMTRLSERVSAVEEHLASAASLPERIARVEERLNSPMEIDHHIGCIENKAVKPSQGQIADTVSEFKERNNDNHHTTISNSKLVRSTHQQSVEYVFNNETTLEKRIELIERRLSALEAGSSLINHENGVPSQITQLDQHSEPNLQPRQGDTEDKDKKPIINKNNGENIEPDVLRFLVDKKGRVTVYIDGVGSKSDGSEGPPGVRVWFGHEHPLNVSRPVSGEKSSNTTQLLAAQIALDISVQAGLKKLRVYSSSNFLLKCMSKLHIWNRKKWCKKNGQPLKHTDDLKKIRQALFATSVFFKKTKHLNEARALAMITCPIKKERE